MRQMGDGLFEQYMSFQRGIAAELRDKILAARA